MNKMNRLSIRKKQNEKTSQQSEIKSEVGLNLGKIPKKYPKLGFRRISNRLIQYEGIYTLTIIPTRRN